MTLGSLPTAANALTVYASHSASPTGTGKPLRVDSDSAISSGSRVTCTYTGASSAGRRTGRRRQSLGSFITHGRCASSW